jgi:hypothetical protein
VLGALLARLVRLSGRHGGRNLRGHHLQDALVLLIEGILLKGPAAKRANDSRADDEGQDASGAHTEGGFALGCLLPGV